MELKELQIPEGNTTQKAPYGLREDGTPKGEGWLGKIPMLDDSGNVMTELSIGVEINGKETLIPSIVPTLTKQEIRHLQGGGGITPSIVRKAVLHAEERIKQGKSPFKD